ncbi:MAG: beta-ketoacyl-ACP synthase II, partial [Rhodospirillaceae bacterium]|nr:beta-ketoacyl-ACP synthase II [Rhodospirillaceae bacterium]
MRRVVITGIGSVTPLGSGIEYSWQSLLKSQSGIDKIQSFDVSDLPVKIAAEVPVGIESDKNFDFRRWVSDKDRRKNDAFIIFGIAAASQAIEDAGWKPEREEDLCRTGVIIGSGIGGLPG